MTISKKEISQLSKALAISVVALSQSNAQVIPIPQEELEKIETELGKTHLENSLNMTNTFSLSLSRQNLSNEDLKFNVNYDFQGKIQEMTIQANSPDKQISKKIIEAAKEILISKGLNNKAIELEEFINSDDFIKLDPYSWNVIYKDGGWVINSKEVEDIF